MLNHNVKVQGIFYGFTFLLFQNLHWSWWLMQM